MNRQTIARAALLVGAIACAACPPVKPPTPGTAPPGAALSPERADLLRQALVSWFQCEECTDKELATVVEQGDAAVPSLAATLQKGPSPAALESVRVHLEENYRDLKDYEKTHPDNKVAQDEKSYVEEYLANVDSLYRTRAAKALGAIGGAAAQKALTQAEREPLRDDVRAAVREALRTAR